MKVRREYLSWKCWEWLHTENTLLLWKAISEVTGNFKVFSLHVFKLLEGTITILSGFSLQIAATCNAVSTFLWDSSFLSWIPPSDQNNAALSQRNLQIHLCKCLNISVRYQNCLQLFMSGLKLSFSFRNTTVTGDWPSLTQGRLLCSPFLPFRLRLLFCLFWELLPFFCVS